MVSQRRPMPAALDGAASDPAGAVITGPWAAPRRPHVPPYHAPKAPPAPVHDGYWKVPNQLVVLAATEALLRGNGTTSHHTRREAPRGWPQNERGLPALTVCYASGAQVTVTVNAYTGVHRDELTPAMVHEMQQVAGRLGDLHADVLDIVLAYLWAYSTPGNDVLWLDDVSLVEARGLTTPHRDARRNGCQTKHRRAVAQALDDLLALRVTYRPSGGYKRNRPLPAGELVTDSVIELSGPPVTVPTTGGTTTLAWPLRFGAWYGRYATAGISDEYVLLSRGIFAFDSYHAVWPKRLARYFSRHGRLHWGKGQGHLVRTVGEILQSTGLDALIPRGRVAEKEPVFAAAMAALCATAPGSEPLFAQLGYTAEARQRQQERACSGAAHHWRSRADWEQDTVSCTLPPAVCAAYPQRRQPNAARQGRKDTKP